MNGVAPEVQAATGEQIPQTPVDPKIDPSIATAITTGAEENAAPDAPAYTANAANGELSSGPVTAAPEKSAELPANTTTTTTTIITTTTGPSSDGGPSSQIQSPNSQLTSSPLPGTAPTSPAVGSEGAAAAPIALGAPLNNLSDAAHAPGSEIKDAETTASPVAAGDAVPAANGTAPGATTTASDAAPAAAAAGLAGGAAAGAGAAGKQEKAHPEMVMKPKEAKKYTKLLKKEAKNDEKDLGQAIKDAESLEKPLRKARKAEQQSNKRHQSAVHDDHKAAKKFNRAKEAYEKTQAALQKALDELDIKKNHTKATQDAFDNAKQRIDHLRDQKILNDKDRARRQASITTTQ